MEAIIPFETMNSWIEEEKKLGSLSADSIVLATASAKGEVHSRVVAIREMTDSGILFFTQKNSRKAQDLSENTSASMTLWLPLKQREVVLDGLVEALTENENERYWETLSRARQLRFSSYQSGKPINSLNDLQQRYELLEKKYDNKKIPLNESYCGYRLVPNKIYFYTLGQEKFSEVVEYVLITGKWEKQLVSP